MDDIINRSFIGTGGFLATLGLAELSEFLSVLVALATLCYMGLSIYKLLQETKK